MADTKISDLAAVSSIVAADQFAVARAGSSHSASAALIRSYCGNATFRGMSADGTANTATTMARVDALTTTLGSGAHRFEYFILFTAAATTTGAGFSVNFTGSAPNFVFEHWAVASGATGAAAGIISSLATIPRITMGMSNRAASSGNVGTFLGVDATANMMLTIKGTFYAENGGDLELYIRSEINTSAVQVRLGTTLLVHGP